MPVHNVYVSQCVFCTVQSVFHFRLGIQDVAVQNGAAALGWSLQAEGLHQTLHSLAELLCGWRLQDTALDLSEHKRNENLSLTN